MHTVRMTINKQIIKNKNTVCRVTGNIIKVLINSKSSRRRNRLVAK